MSMRLGPHGPHRLIPWRLGHLSDATITLYLAGELPPAVADATQRHLVGCERCARACEVQHFAHQTVSALTVERPVPPALDARLRAELASAKPQVASRPLRFLWPAVGVRQAARPYSPTKSPLGLRRGSGFWSMAAVVLIALASALVFNSIRAPSQRVPTGLPSQGIVPGWSCRPPIDQQVLSAWQLTRANVTLNAISMLSADSGWAVGEYNGSRGVILRYTAGEWILFTSTSNAVLRGISMDGPDDGWAVGEDCTHPGHSLMLHYSGGSWVPVPVADVGPLYAVAMLCRCAGWAAGQHGLLHYTDGVWVAVSLPAQSHPQALSALALGAPGTAWAAGRGGALALETGDSWSAVASSASGASAPDWNALSVFPDGSAWAAGSLGVGGPGVLAYTHDTSWTTQAAPTANPLYGIGLSSFDEGWAVGGDESGVILHLSQGAWSVEHMPWVPGMRAVAVVSPTEAWAVGREGAILHLRAGVWQSVSCSGL